MRQECVSRTEEQVEERLLHVPDAMVACETKGMSRDGYLPGNLRVRRARGTGSFGSMPRTRLVIRPSPRTG
jgi:L-serine deaminase